MHISSIIEFKMRYIKIKRKQNFKRQTYNSLVIVFIVAYICKTIHHRSTVDSKYRHITRFQLQFLMFSENLYFEQYLTFHDHLQIQFCK